MRPLFVTETGRIVSRLRAGRFVERRQAMPAFFRHHLEALFGAVQCAE